MRCQIREKSLKNVSKKEKKSKPSIQEQSMYRKSRQFAALLCVILTVMNLPGITEVFAKEADGRCEHHTVHTEECCYNAEMGDPCTYACSLCEDGTENGDAQTGTSETPKETGENTDADGSEAVQGDVSTDTDMGNADVPEDSDHVSQDADMPADEAVTYAAAKVITSWEWMDENQIFAWNGKQWEATLHMDVQAPSAAGTPPYFTGDELRERLAKVLPVQIRARLQDGTEETVAVSWEFADQLDNIETKTGWTKDITAKAVIDPAYSLGKNVKGFQSFLKLRGPKKFLNSWDYVARTGTTITSNMDKTKWSMDVYTFGLTAEKVKEALKKVLPEEIYASGYGLNAGDVNGQGGFRYDESSAGRRGWLKIEWLLDRFDNVTFHDGQSFTAVAEYDTFWGVNENIPINNGDLIRSHLKMTINLHDLNLNGNIETEKVADPEATTVNLFDYWVEDYGKEPKEPQGDILGKSDWHLHEDDNGNLLPTAAAYSMKEDWNKGINKGHLLLFGDGLIHAGLWNKGAGEKTRYGRANAGMEGIVKPVLEDGYPVLNTEDAKKTLTDGKDYKLVKDWMLAGDHDEDSGQKYAGKDHQNLSNTVIDAWGKDIKKEMQKIS